ncbi:hypothetical protein JCM11491_001373 [Sporobolomyces phaffii]
MSDVGPFQWTPEMITGLLDLRSKILANERFIISWLAIVWFDTLATLPDERLLWSSRWSVLKVFFLLNRWISPSLQSLWAALVFLTISPKSCSKIYWLQPASITVIMLLSAVLMSIRVYALYSNKKILFLLSVVVVLEIAAMAAAASQFHPLLLSPGLGKIVNLQGCVATGPDGRASALVAVFWAAPLTFDTIIVGLTLWNILVINKRAKHLPALANILRDGNLFYLVISLANLVNVALYAQHDVVIQNFNNPTSTALTSIMASRLVTSLRKMDTTHRRRTLESRTSLGRLRPWSPPVPASQSFEPSLSRRHQPSEVPSLRSKGDDLDDEEQASGGIEGLERGDEVELAPMGGHSLAFRSDSNSNATRPRPCRRQRRGAAGVAEAHGRANAAIVGLERLGLIAPSTALDISRPFGALAAAAHRAPFSDVVPYAPGAPAPSPTFRSHFDRSRNGSDSFGRNGRSGGGGGGGGEREGGGPGEGTTSGFAITVERETVVSVAAHA